MAVLYRDCVQCDAGCSGIVNDPALGLTPRGFWVSERVRLPLEILVVGKNPGNASPDQPESREAARLRGRPEALRDHAIGFAGLLLERREPGFHRTLLRILDRLLPPGDWDTVERSVAVTELAKCQGVDEQGKIPYSTIDRCVEAWLRPEMEIFRPRMILALGREAERGLVDLLSEPWRSRVVYCYHPSYGIRNLAEIEARWGELRSAEGSLVRARKVVPRAAPKPRLDGARMSTEDGSAGPPMGSARRRSVQWADGRATSTLNRLHGSPRLNRFDGQTVEAFLRELAARAATVGRGPTRIEFSTAERESVAGFFRDLKRGLRQQSFVALSRLLGTPLDRKRWSLLFDANYVKDMAFLVGGDTVKGGNDWNNKCFGLSAVNPGVFVVGLNDLFFRNAGDVLAHSGQKAYRT